MKNDKLVSTALRAGAITALAVGVMMVTVCKSDEPGPSEVKLQANPYKKMMEEHSAGKDGKPAAGAPGGTAPSSEAPAGK